MGAYNVVSPAAMVAGQPEDVSVVLANFNAIAAVLNGGIDNSNINAAAAILLSKLAGYPADGTKFAAGDGTWKTITNPLTVIKPGALTFSNSAAEKDLLGVDGTGYSIPANTLGANSFMRVTVIGDLFNTSAGTINLTTRVKLGATTLYDSAAQGLASGAGHRIFFMQFMMAMLGATNAQWFGGTAGWGSQIAVTTGIGNMEVAGSYSAAGSTNESNDWFGQNGNSAVDMTAIQALRVTHQWASANAGAGINGKVALIEVFS